MKNLRDILYFVIINIIMIFNAIPLMAAVFVAFISGLIFIIIYDNAFPALIGMSAYIATITFMLFLPIKFIIYPIIYEYIEKSSIIFKFLNKIKTNKLIAILVFLLLCLLDYMIYLYLPKNLVAYSPDDWIHFYKKTQLLGLTLCFLCLLLWFKIRKPKNNGKILFCYYIVLTVIFLSIVVLLKFLNLLI